MSDNTNYEGADQANGNHPIVQDTKNDFSGLANSSSATDVDDDQPVSGFHSLFYDLFTWKFPRATGAVFLSTILSIIAFRYVNVLRYLFKATYMLFAAVSFLEIAGKPLGAKGVVSSFRPRRYYTVPRESLERLFENLHDLANFFLLEFQRVLFVENIAATLSAFITSFLGYFLIKYIPFWALLLLATTTAFTAPLIYINNQEVIDEQINHLAELVNAQLDSGKKLTEKYAGDAITQIKAKTADLQSKAQEYTNGKKAVHTNGTNGTNGTHSKPAASTLNAHDFLSDAPDAPTHEPFDASQEPAREENPIPA